MSETNPRNEFISDLIEKYSDTLLKVAFSYLKNLHDAEDIVHDVFVKLIQKNPVFENEEHEKAWLIRVTINLCKNHFKTAWYKKTVPLDSSIAFTDMEHEVVDAVMELSDKYRIVILLYYIMGYDIKDIARILKKKESTVSSQLIRGRQKLKIILKEDFDYE